MSAVTEADLLACRNFAVNAVAVSCVPALARGLVRCGADTAACRDFWRLVAVARRRRPASWPDAAPWFERKKKRYKNGDLEARSAHGVARELATRTRLWFDSILQFAEATYGRTADYMLLLAAERAKEVPTVDPAALTDDIVMEYGRAVRRLAKVRPAETPAVIEAGPRWRTLAQVVALTNYPKSSLYRAACSGKIRTNGKTRRDLRLDLDDVERYVTANPNRNPDGIESEAQVKRAMRKAERK